MKHPVNILFIHQNFPGQFGHLAPALAAAGHQVVALTLNQAPANFGGVAVRRYADHIDRHVAAVAKGGKPDDWESKIIRGRAAADALVALRDQGFAPDLIFAHPGWGEALFIKDVFPKARLLTYAEYYYGAEGGDTSFDPEFARPSLADSQRVTLKNTHLLHALSSCDGALSPTEFQKAQHPAWGQEKIRVIHDGIDTRHFRPNAAAWVQLQSAGVTLRQGDEVITFVARHLEPYRGYHIFMRALPLLQKLRPQARVVIVGGDGVSYGAAPPPGQTWKSIFLGQVEDKLDMSRIHFVGKLPHHLLTNLMQVSATHVYLTYPFVLSWSLLEAMSIGCLVVASDTAPLREVIRHEENGILTDFFDAEELARRVAFALERRADLMHLRAAARATVERNYDLTSICLPRQIDFVLN